MNYAKAIRVLRAAKGISQQDLAKQAEISKSLLSKIESGLRELTKLNQKKIAEALEVPASLLDILAIDKSEKSVSNETLQQIGDALINLSDEIKRIDAKKL